ncbi:MAG TPA: rhomboid family intramembrane serine protease [Chitinophagaceae bacterium]|nr:rhomboid family intramembrane serine protease [Chitinophagaceae bacterium]
MGILTERSRPLFKFSLGDNHNMVVRLILINLVVFVALLFTKVVYMLTGQPKEIFTTQVIPWAVLSANPATLLTHPWTLVTFMFVHINFWHLVSSLIWLWWFGELLQGLSGYRHVVPVYFYGGLAGALFFMLAYGFVPGMHLSQDVANSINIGAAASVIAIIFCVTMIAPNYRVFPMLGGGIPIYVITIVYIGLSLLGQGGGIPYGYLAAQTGGALLGVAYGLRLKKGYDPGEGLNRLIFRIGHLMDPVDDTLRPIRVKEKKYKKTVRKMDPPYKRIGPVAESKVDDILDKINQSGYHSLSSEEKDILMRASQQKKMGEDS